MDTEIVVYHHRTPAEAFAALGETYERGEYDETNGTRWFLLRIKSGDVSMRTYWFLA